ncbi:MAG: pyruvate formate lyase family protein [Fibromonadaceae bacterium]|jgi:formate C-acetyltransferase|nr:pyruvate formate lyase family protein [Fibromonadaceae bacterium]
MNFSQEMTKRAKGLYDQLINKALGDRSGEWFTQDMFPKFFSKVKPKDYGLEDELKTKTVLVRRAIAIDIMLKAMTNPKNSKKTHTAEIFEGDLLLGVLPMGSNGLGKVFPQFMTDDELRAGSVTNRNTMSLFGHNTMNYDKLLSSGLKKTINDCDKEIAKLLANEEKIKKNTGIIPSDLITDQESKHSREVYKNKTSKDFYVGVKIACKAVIDYAHRFAEIATKESKNKSLSQKRRTELENMARIAKRVPEHPAKTFHEAMQSITFFHIALHASMNFISLGRLDQVLKKFVEKELDKGRALEIMECFMIKLAGRLNLSSDYLHKQDHVDYATVLGTNPYYIDQKAGVNNFLQNIIVGGKTPDGGDGTNAATYLILQAIENVNLSTPGIYVRLHKGSPETLYKKVARSIEKTKNNPSIINDDVMVEAMHRTLMRGMPASKKEKMLKIARDYCVDGCWELILNGKSDWTFTMFNAMTALETSVNQGASLSPTPELFRGAKIAPYAPMPKTFKKLMETYEKQLRFFVDQCAMSMFLYYMIDEYAAPSPLFSAFLDGCMERGRDKAWAGADYNLAGIIFGGIPNVVNTLLGIQKWVFPKKGKGKYTLEEVADAFRFNFKCPDPTQKATQNTYTSVQIDFDTNTPKFGSNSKEVTEVVRKVLDICYSASMNSADFAKKVYEDKPKKEDWKNVIALRRLTGYYGSALRRKFEDFNMRFTVGLGTFEQYNWQGRGIAACADRQSGEPLAPNFSPVPGTLYGGIANLLNSMKSLELERFAGGVITDVCLDEKNASAEVIVNLLKQAIKDKAGMLTLSIGSEKIYREIYEKVLAASKITNKENACKLLAPYAGINVRIGGWQTPFITLPISHMENYIHRPSK